jgi:hypothetical protein
VLACVVWATSWLSSACGRIETSDSLKQSFLGENQRFWVVSTAADALLSQSHALMPYMRAAAQRELPLRFFRELIEVESSVTVVEGNWPSYRPGIFYGGTILMPSADHPGAWSRGEWASFYNELFHAWYGLIFLKADQYASMRKEVQTSERLNFYQRAHPANPALAQEEAWSETVASLMILLAPIKINNQWQYRGVDEFAYVIDKTVAPVSHSDRPGYTPQAEQTYPAAWEYKILFKLLTMVQLP